MFSINCRRKRVRKQPTLAFGGRGKGRTPTLWCCVKSSPAIGLWLPCEPDACGASSFVVFKLQIYFTKWHTPVCLFNAVSREVLSPCLLCFPERGKWQVKDGTFAGGGGKERCVSEMEHHVVFHLVQVSRFCCTECDGIIPGGFKSHDQE